MLKTRQELEASRLKRINASTFFMPQQLVPSEDAQTVVVRGRLRTLVNGQETANEAQGLRGRIQLQRRPHAPEDLPGGDPCGQVNT